MTVVATDNEDGCRFCQQLSCKSRYPRFTVTLLYQLQLLMMIYCCVHGTEATVHQWKTAAMVADDAVVWTSSARPTLSPPAAADCPPENVGHGKLASLPRRDTSDRGRRGSAGWRSLIAVRRSVRPAGLDRRPAEQARTEVVNKVKPQAATTATAALVGMPWTAAERAHLAPVIKTPRGHHDLPSRIQIRSTSSDSRPSFSVVDNSIGTSYQQPKFMASNAPFINANKAFTRSFEQICNTSVQSKSTNCNPDDCGNNSTARNYAVDDSSALLDISRDGPSLRPSLGHVLCRTRRHSGVESIDKVDKQTPQLKSTVSLLSAINSTSTDGTSTESSVAQLNVTEEAGSVDAPLSAAALQYRSRNNLVALVDPLKSSRGSASASANKLRHRVTVDDSWTSSSRVAETITPPNSTSTSAYNDSDSVEIRVLEVGVNRSAANSVNGPLNDVGDEPNSTVSPPGEWNCSSAINVVNRQEAIRTRMTDSTVAAVFFALSCLFALVAAWALTSVILSLFMRNQGSSPITGRRSSSRLVLGFVAIAAAARTLYYVSAEYQLLAAVATPAGRRAIYECYSPLIIAAFFAHVRLFHAEAATHDKDLTSTEAGHQRFWLIRFRCELFVFTVSLCFYLTLVLSVCLLIQFCIARVDAVFILRFVFALFAVLLSAMNVNSISAFFGRHIASQVVLCTLFIVCAGFSAVNAASLISSDFKALFQQNADVLIAVEAAERLAELFIAIVFCAESSSKFSRFRCEKVQKSAGAGQKIVSGTKIDDRTAANRRQVSVQSVKSPRTSHLWLSRLLDYSSKSKVVDVGSAGPPQMSLDVIQSVGWTSTEEEPTNVDCTKQLPLPRSRSMLYNDHGFIRFRLEGDTDGESDARTLDDDDGGGSGPGQVHSVPASEYASADDLSSRRGPSSVGTPRWSRPGSPSLAGFRAPSIHLQDSIDRALDRCDIWRVGREQGRLSVDELRRIVQLYAADDCRRGNQRRRAAGINFTEV